MSYVAAEDPKAPAARAGEPRLGAWCAIPNALTAEALARAGYDWICIDMQHGCMDYAQALDMIRAIEATPCTIIVRVPCNEPGIIGRVLDAGAHGVIIPMIQSLADAQAAVAACLYPPEGRRSFGPMRVGLREGGGYFGKANRQTLVIPMIETASALAAVNEIAQTPGVSALFLGPFDMSVALGLPPKDNDGQPPFDEAVKSIVQATRTAGIKATVLGSSKVYAKRAAQGFDMIAITTDLSALLVSARADLTAARANSASP